MSAAGRIEAYAKLERPGPAQGHCRLTANSGRPTRREVSLLQSACLEPGVREEAENYEYSDRGSNYPVSWYDSKNRRAGTGHAEQEHHQHRGKQHPFPLYRLTVSQDQHNSPGNRYGCHQTHGMYKSSDAHSLWDHHQNGDDEVSDSRHPITYPY